MLGGRYRYAIAIESNEVFFATFVLSFVRMIASMEGKGEHASKGHEGKRIDLC